MEIEPLKAVEDDFDSEIFLSPEEIEEPTLQVSYRDFYVLGKLWINILETALVGTKVSLFPVVEAAKPLGPPQKPEPMKYNDLPLYTSPHYEYKDYVENKHRCPQANTKLLQEYLLPHVKTLRKCTESTYCGIKCSLKTMKGEACESIRSYKKDFKKKMRDPDHLAIRRAVVILGTTAGFLLSAGRNLPRSILFTGLGTLATGALCFPKETDEAFRTFTYHSAKAGITFYNILCGKEFVLRERLLCKEDLPPQLRRTNPCPKKEK